MEILSGFIIGLIGSFHCIGMCGPIVLSLPADKYSKLSFISGRILYNLGRIITYSFLGAAFGFLGNRLYLIGLQRGISISIGIILLVSVITGIFFKKSKHLNIFAVKIISFLKKIIKINFDSRSKLTFLMTGVLNGILPCGFVYFGLSGAMISGEATTGALYMMLFGLGTIPLMFGLSVFGNFISLNFRKMVNRSVPVFALVLALLFILRGLGLGIPFFSPSPEMNSEIDKTEIQCN